MQKWNNTQEGVKFHIKWNQSNRESTQDHTGQVYSVRRKSPIAAVAQDLFQEKKKVTWITTDFSANFGRSTCSSSLKNTNITRSAGMLNMSSNDEVIVVQSPANREDPVECPSYVEKL